MNNAEDTRRIVRWYQTILSTVGGYVDVPVNGNHNDVQTKAALRDFQRTHALEASGFLTVASNVALNQVALQGIYRRTLTNTIGKASAVLSDQIKEFQSDYGLDPDGKVGRQTMLKTVDVLNGTLPPPYADWQPELNAEPFLGGEDGDAEQAPDLVEAAAVLDADPGVIADDNREAQTNTIKEPNRWICLMDVAMEVWSLTYGSTGTSQEQSGFVWALGGTGLLISPRHVLTAAHVVTNFGGERSGRYTQRFIAKTVVASAGYNGGFGPLGRKSFREPYGSATAQKRPQHPSGFGSVQKQSVSVNSFDDYALVELPKPINLLAPVQTRRFIRNGKVHKEDRQLPPLGYWGSGAGFEIRSTTPQQLHGQKIDTIGYPSKAPKVDTRPRKPWMQWLAGGTVNNVLNNSATHPFLFFHTADTTNSQSGSPIWTRSRVGNQEMRTLVGIVISARLDNKFNQALALTDRVLQQIQRWAPDTFNYAGGRLTVKP